MPEITILSDTKAEGTWSMYDFLEWEPGSGSQRTMWGYGHYRERYRKCDDEEWRISVGTNVRQIVDGNYLN